MKRLILASLLIIPLVIMLFSCGEQQDREAHAPPLEKSIFEYVSTDKGTQAISEIGSVSIDGDYDNCYGDFLTTVKGVPNGTEYSVYSLESLEKIASYTLYKSQVTAKISKLHFEVPKNCGDYLAVIKKLYPETGYRYSLIDKRGNVLFESKEMLNYLVSNRIVFYGKNHFTFNGCIYRLEEGKFVYVARILDLKLEGITEYRYLNGKYVAYKQGTKEIVVFSDKLEVEKSHRVQGENVSVIWLNGGNFLVQSYTQCQEGESCFVKTYEGIEYKLTSYLLNPCNFTYTEIENCPYSIQKSIQITGVTVDEDKTLVEAKKIENSHTGKGIYLILDKNGTLFATLELPEGFLRAERLDDNRIKVYHQYGCDIYTDDGAIYLRLNNVDFTYMQGGYFYGEDGIYNEDYERIFSFKDLSQVSLLQNGAVYFSRFDSENTYTYKSYIWKNGIVTEMEEGTTDVGIWGYKTVVYDKDAGTTKTLYRNTEDRVIFSALSTRENVKTVTHIYKGDYLIIVALDSQGTNIHVFK